MYAEQGRYETSKDYVLFFTWYISFGEFIAKLTQFYAYLFVFAKKRKMQGTGDICFCLYKC